MMIASNPFSSASFASTYLAAYPVSAKAAHNRYNRNICHFCSTHPIFCPKLTKAGCPRICSLRSITFRPSRGLSMRANKVFFAALVGLCLNGGMVHAQGNNPAVLAPPPVVKDTTQPASAETADEGGTGLSNWITYADHENCAGCNGKGGGMPILTEGQFRIGPAFPVGGEFLSQNIRTGWMVEGALRALFFNQPWDRAWAVELGISNTYNPSSSNNPILFEHSRNVTVTVRSLDRTFVNLALGREWYLWAPANSEGPHLRFGADVGGRWGSGVIQFNEITHHEEVIEGMFGAIHADLEIPRDRWTFLAGIRGEYGFTWSNLFGPGRGNMEDLTLLFDLGVRY
jgi:hypothetical protein